MCVRQRRRRRSDCYVGTNDDLDICGWFFDLKITGKDKNEQKGGFIGTVILYFAILVPVLLLYYIWYVLNIKNKKSPYDILRLTQGGLTT